MKIEEVIKQLESILDHVCSMAASPDADDIWRKDIDALKFALTALRSMPGAGKKNFRVITQADRSSGCEALHWTYDIDTDHEIITNADRIRGMSDEELAVFLDELTCFCVVCNEHDGKNENCPIYRQGCGKYCEPKDFMCWLQQPAEED